MIWSPKAMGAGVLAMTASSESTMTWAFVPP
jgi:hypothetical protein